MDKQALLDKFAAVMGDHARFPHKREVTLPMQRLTPLLRDIFKAMTARELPETTWPWGLYPEERCNVSDTFLTEEADGLVVLSTGSMSCAGTWYSYYLLVGTEVRMSTGDKSEDNIADWTEAEFSISATSPEALERAVAALMTAAKR